MYALYDLHMVVMIAGIHISQGIFAVDMLTGIKTPSASPLFLFGYSDCLTRAPLNYSLEALSRFQGGGYTHAALETVQN